MLVLHSMNTARKYHGKMKLLPGPDIHTAVQPERDSGSLPQYSIRQHSQHETLLDKKTLQNQAPRNRGVITHQNLASLWSTHIVYTLWIVITSDNLPPSPFLNNMVLQVFFLLPFSQSFSFFLRVLFLRLAVGDFCFACN